MMRQRARCRESASAALPAALLAALGGCQHAPAMPAMRPPSPVLAATVAAPVPAPDDWHGLLIAPFGTVLKAIPVALHEVLLFREDPAAALPECYATDGSLPKIAGHTPDEYVLCFQYDRLARVQVSVSLTAAEAAEVFAAGCASAAPSAAPESGVACERDGAVRFSARFDEGTLSLTLETAAAP